MFENFDLDNIITPVKVKTLDDLLKATGYDNKKRKTLVKHFTEGFPLGYQGQRKNIKRNAPNLRLRVGDEIDLWNKVMKEVKLKRCAGQFETIPFEDYIQSPVGLVPKDNGKDTRLIFHLSYPRSGKSVNSETPKDLCSVKYPDFEEAIIRCIEESRIIESSGGQSQGHVKVRKTDLKSAFRFVPIKKSDWMLLVMKAKNPLDGKWYFFIDKCMPFGGSISCAHFQSISDALAHIQKHKTGRKAINYLDDFLFAAFCRALCDGQLKEFIEICEELGIPIAIEKTEWGSTCMVFLGLLIDTKNKLVAIPANKVERAKELIQKMLMVKKVKMYQIQKLCGFLNFLCRCIVPGRAFTRRLYAYTANLKPHHHVHVNREIRSDLEMWNMFLNNPTVYSRPFMDYSKEWNAEISLGFGGICEEDWMYGQWDEFTRSVKPSIEYLELFALTAGILAF